MEKKTALLAAEEELLVDLTFHGVPASLLTEFAEKIVRPYFNGNLNAAFQDLMQKALSEQDFILDHITHVRTSTEAQQKNCVNSRKKQTLKSPSHLRNGESR